MNNLFKKTGKTRIELDDNFSLETDTFKGVVLIQAVQKERNKKDGSGKETYTAFEKWYYPRAVMALEKYFHEKHNSDLENIKANTEEALKVLKEFKDNFKDW